MRTRKKRFGPEQTDPWLCGTAIVVAAVCALIHAADSYTMATSLAVCVAARIARRDGFAVFSL